MNPSSDSCPHWKELGYPDSGILPPLSFQPVMTTTLAELLKDSAYRLTQF